MPREFAQLIQSESEYDAVVAEIDELLDAHPQTRGVRDRLEFLSVLVAEYDRRHHELPGPDITPQEVVEFLLETRDMEKSDLGSVMGGRSRVSEFFSGKRELSLAQIQSLRALFNVPADVLLAGPSRDDPKPTRIATAYAAYLKEAGGRAKTHLVRERSEVVHVLPAKSGKYVVKVRGKVLTKPANKDSTVARATAIARDQHSTVAIHDTSGRIVKEIGRDPRSARHRRSK